LTAGSDPTANTITFVLYELAFNPLVQKQLQQEIDLVLQKYGGKMSYESMKDMAYLDLVIQETNRKYSLAGFMRRVCSIPYQIPGTDVVIEKGTKIVIPMHAIHNDPSIYPEPEKFIPERFEGNNHRSNGGKYLPFGDGPSDLYCNEICTPGGEGLCCHGDVQVFSEAGPENSSSSAFQSQNSITYSMWRNLDSISEENLDTISQSY
ncbi:probable cytochrome P450 6a13, partial [Homalodisca vitripennis]|uniref:probable cytochrome P450 6a13 n=1 Tax=Homalodisca vitripennis TaxID=197043 RepID=UPI001EEAD7AC